VLSYFPGAMVGAQNASKGRFSSSSSVLRIAYPKVSQQAMKPRPALCYMFSTHLVPHHGQVGYKMECKTLGRSVLAKLI
jgi:hypothetical protein